MHFPTKLSQLNPSHFFVAWMFFFIIQSGQLRDFGLFSLGYIQGFIALFTS